jgi:ATP-dependent helicase/nuclease subunit A
VHASKGLQAPIVYLPDTTRIPRDLDRLLTAKDGETRLWLPRSDDANEAARAWRAEARDRSLQEQNRLLYVAMTRAEDRLYVGGWIGSKQQDRAAGTTASPPALPRASRATAFEPRYGRRARPSTSPSSSARRLDGDGFELVNDGRIDVPEQQELALEPAPRSRPGRASRRPPSPIRRRRSRRRSRCPTRRRRRRAPSARSHPDDRAAGSAAG